MKRKLNNTPEGIAARAAGRRKKLDRLAAEMHAFYSRGKSLAQTGRAFGRGPTAVREMFLCRGMPLRPTPFRLPPRDPRTGHPLRQRQLSAAEIEQLIAATPRLRVPDVIRVEWRVWSLERRGDFIRRLRARLGGRNERPSGAFSANVTPFDYGTAAAHAIVKAMNAGLDSRAARCKLDICTQGVIYRGTLWFWCHRSGAYVSSVGGRGERVPLHHAIWSEHHGREVPRGHVLSFIDGNRNNLTAENMALRTRNDLVRANQAHALTKQSRARVELLFARSRSGGTPTIRALAERAHA